MYNRKLSVVIGITGNQGGSVARTFLSDPKLRDEYRLRGISRDPSSAASQALLTAGVEEIVQADLDDVDSLERAFEDASVIFSVTDFWQFFLQPAHQEEAKKRGLGFGEYAYQREYAQGRNVADAAAKISTLDRFVASILNSPKKWSNGAYNHLWHYESKADMVTYIKEQHPELAAKSSWLNMGVFYTSWRFMPIIAPQKMSDGTFKMTLPCNPNTPVPLVDPRHDTGLFVRALLQVGPGINLYGETALISWTEYMRIWSSIMEVQGSYEECSRESWEQALPGGLGKELADMLHYMGAVGYDGGDPESVRKENLGDEIPDLTSLEWYIRQEEWTPVGLGRAP